MAFLKEPPGVILAVEHRKLTSSERKSVSEYIKRSKVSKKMQTRKLRTNRKPHSK